jgi:hypothetical protein
MITLKRIIEQTPLRLPTVLLQDACDTLRNLSASIVR